MTRPEGPRTHLIHWRGDVLEFARSEGCGFNSTAVAAPPWYVVRYRGMGWGRDKWHYHWLDYGGPPKLFLTRKRAEINAKAFRKQYGSGKECGNGPLKVEVVRVMPCDAANKTQKADAEQHG